MISSGTEAASAQFDEEFAFSSEDETSTDELPSKHRRMDCESEEKSFTNDSENQASEDVCCFLARRSVKLITSDLFSNSSPDTNVVKE